MADLPKRGDRVRVTEAHEHSLLSPGDEITLTSDAYECGGRQAFGDAPPDAVAFMFESSVDGECGSHAVKVEILERSGDTFTLTCRKCGRSMRLEGPMKRADTTIDECALCDEKSAEFARGMRRAVEIAERLCDPSGQQNSAPTLSLRALKEAVEKEGEP